MDHHFNYYLSCHGEFLYSKTNYSTLIDTISQPFLASVTIDTSVVQAGGNSKFPMIVTMIGIWVVRTLGVYIFAWKLGFGLPAVWTSIAIDNALRAALFAGYRKRKNVIRNLE